MIKTDLARIVYETHGGMSYREARSVVDAILATMKTELSKGRHVKLTGFGSFNVIHRKGRMGRNPQTGERIQLPPSCYVSFRPSRMLDL